MALTSDKNYLNYKLFDHKIYIRDNDMSEIVLPPLENTPQKYVIYLKTSLRVPHTSYSEFIG